MACATFGNAVGQTIVICRLPCSQATKTMACATFGTAVEQTFAVCRLPCSQAQKTMACATCGNAVEQTIVACRLPCSQATKNDGLRHLRECSGADVRGVSSARLAGHKKRWPAPLSGMQWSRRSWPVVCRARRPQKTMACATFGNAVEQTIAVCRLPCSQATKNDGLRHFRECSRADDRGLSSAVFARPQKTMACATFGNAVGQTFVVCRPPCSQATKKRWPAPLSGMQWSRRSRCVVCVFAGHKKRWPAPLSAGQRQRWAAAGYS
jgi:hypothetical protein